MKWKKALVPPKASLLDTMKAISEGNRQLSMVVDSENRLLGTVTDGDIRRAILKNIDVSNTPVSEIMNKTPHIAKLSDTDEIILNVMRTSHVRGLPVLDDFGRVVSLVHQDDLLQPKNRFDNWVVIMAGGLGKRLRPLTEETPKPLLPVGSKPLLETIIENFLSYNFDRFYISVNYKGHLIQNHFGDGSRWNAEFVYLEEKTRLGTAGALHLIKERPKKPVIVMNGDLLTRVNFEFLLDFHMQEGAVATMCVREYDFQVPYGVVAIENHRIQSIDEKPVQRFFVNAGIYVLNPELFDLIPVNEYFDMTTLFERCIAEGMETTVFPIKEYWMDVGRMVDLERAQTEFKEVFTN